MLPERLHLMPQAGHHGGQTVGNLLKPLAVPLLCSAASRRV